jgi:transposase-like protein
MRYPACEKLELIQLVEHSHLPVRRTLVKLGIPRATFFRWYDLYRTGGPDALGDRSPRPDRVWNQIPDISPRIFTAMILMAPVSTALTMPLARRTLARAGADWSRRLSPCLIGIPDGPDATPLTRSGLASANRLLRLRKRRVADHPPASDRSGILDRQFGFDHPDPIEPIGAHRHIERLAKLLLFGSR